MISASIRSEFEHIVGAQYVRSTEGITLPRSWTVPPDVEVSPGSVAEVIATVLAAEKANVAIVPVGYANQLGTGYPPVPDRPLILVSTRRLNAILDHQPDDLTITCEAGVTLSQVEHTLRKHSQTLALNGPRPEATTLGGMVAAATTGLRRIAYGTPRDTLIGMRAVMSGGIEVKGGGKVVKNVAGYDVCKLFTGSWGSIGIITELTFKVRPLPEVRRRLAWHAPDVIAAVNAGFKLHLARLAPTMVLAAADLHGLPALIIGLEGAAQRVEWQAAEFGRRIAAEDISTPLIELTEAHEAELNDWPAIMTEKSNAAARVACLPSELAEVVSRISAIPSANILADCAVGTLHCSFRSADCATVTAVRGALPSHANCVWTLLDIDGDCVSSTPRWGDAREDRLLQKSIKGTLDPLSTFSPGRFPGSGR